MLSKYSSPPMKQGFLPDWWGWVVDCSLDIREEGCCSYDDGCDKTVLSLQSLVFGVWSLSDISVQSGEDEAILLCPFRCVSPLTSSKKLGAAGLISVEMFAWTSAFEFEVSVAMKIWTMIKDFQKN